MGALTPEALGGYEYVAKISDEHIKRTATYLLKSKHDSLSSFLLFVQFVVIPSGFRVESFRVYKLGEFIGKDIQGSCIQAGVPFEYASSSTP